ncbi:iron dicitrate transport regulator FecR, partial [Azoarcus sp. TTM-91]|uniref:FecR domain-containing protein n=1 Tax=Azoarcus sp. TTM-91 TaxID=2691581 RepID=UPI0016977DBD
CIRDSPFRVHTPEGSVRALGTRFSVRRLGEATRSAVFEEAVEIRPADGPALILGAGQQTTFKRDGIASPQGVDAAAAAWEQGMLVARDMRLADVVAELDRYRLGLLRCDPAIAGLRISGVISLRDTDAGLDALAHTLPLRIQRHSRYWVDIQAL